MKSIINIFKKKTKECNHQWFFFRALAQHKEPMLDEAKTLWVAPKVCITCLKVKWEASLD